MPVVRIADENAFQTELQKAAGKLVIIDFTATWCGSCKQIAPFFEELSNKYPSSVFLKVDVDDNSEIAMEYDVTAMPTFLFLKKLKEIDRVLGADYQGLENRVHNWSSSTSSFVDSSTHQNSREGTGSTQNKTYESNKDTPLTTSQTRSLTSDKINTNTHAAVLALSNSLNQGPNQAAIAALTNSFSNPPLPPPPLPPTGPPLAPKLSSQIKNRPIHLLPPGYSPYYLSQIPNGGNMANSIPTALMKAQFDSNRGQGSLIPDQNSLMEKDEGINSNQVHETSMENEMRKNEGKSETTSTKEKRKKSSHRTRSTHRKESQHSSTNSSQPATKVNKENETFAQKALKVKKKLPMSVVQIRLADGSKMTATFNTSHTVSKIREFINNARPAYATKSFILSTIFPSREISNEDQTLQDAKLVNAVVVQKLT